MPPKNAPVACSTVNGRERNTLVPFAYRAGDFLLRAGTEAWIQDLTQGLYSHAGICTDAEEEEAADAHPVDGHRAKGQEVANVPIHEFFNAEHAPGGGDVFRHPDKAAALKAAQWAQSQCGQSYEFEIMDPIIGPTGQVEENNKLYCSEFVWRSYVKGAGVRIVEEGAFINLLSEENVDRTVTTLIPHAREEMNIPSAVPDSKIRPRLLEELKKKHNGFFISPSQLAKSPKVRHVHAVRGGAVRAGQEEEQKEKKSKGSKSS